jgi:hypothetical protein
VMVFGKQLGEFVSNSTGRAGDEGCLVHHSRYYLANCITETSAALRPSTPLSSSCVIPRRTATRKSVYAKTQIPRFARNDKFF